MVRYSFLPSGTLFFFGYFLYGVEIYGRVGRGTRTILGSINTLGGVTYFVGQNMDVYEYANFYVSNGDVRFLTFGGLILGRVNGSLKRNGRVLTITTLGFDICQTVTHTSGNVDETMVFFKRGGGFGPQFVVCLVVFFVGGYQVGYFRRSTPSSRRFIRADLWAISDLVLFTRSVVYYFMAPSLDTTLSDKRVCSPGKT